MVTGKQKKAGGQTAVQERLARLEALLREVEERKAPDTAEQLRMAIETDPLLRRIFGLYDGLIQRGCDSGWACKIVASVFTNAGTKDI